MSLNIPKDLSLELQLQSGFFCKFHKWNDFYFSALLPVLNEGRRGVTITTVLPPGKAAFS